MSHANLTAPHSVALSFGYRPGNVLRLSIAQALAGANSTVVYATAAVVGHMLAPSEVLATLPISIFVVGMAVGTLPAGSIARRYGRRAAFMSGTGCGALAGLLAALAILLSSFSLFYAAVVLSFRFAAAHCVPPERRALALSAVMAGGMFAGVIGPQLVTYTMDLWQPYTFAASFLAQAAVAALAALILSGVRLPKPTAAEIAGGQSIGTVVRQPRLFLGASALVLECHRPEERTRAQSLNDFVVFGMMTLGSFASDGLLTAYGWNTVIWVSFIPLAAAIVALGFRASSRAAA